MAGVKHALILLAAAFLAGCSSHRVEERVQHHVSEADRARAEEHACDIGNRRGPLPYSTIYGAFSAPASSVTIATRERGWCGRSYGGTIVIGIYEDCPREHQYDLRDIYGVGQGPTEQAARNAAEDACRNALTGLYRDHGELRHSTQIQCVTTARLCPSPH